MDKHRRIADDTMAVSSGPAPEAYEAAVAAMQRFVVEAFTLLGIEILVTTLRTYARVKTVGFRELSLDDLLAWLAMVSCQLTTYNMVKAVSRSPLRRITPSPWWIPSKGPGTLRQSGTRIILSGTQSQILRR